ncbi:MAG: FeoA family protein [Desulfurispora sp.]|uniref:FeoA family protein n=1 Tax=Desulfurispora sp. TaxID=3014275 RepID=UPI0040498EE3
MTTLDRVKRGQAVQIAAIENEQMRAQAIRFGIAEGAVVTCQEIVPAGPVVIARSNQEIAIGRHLARKIKVKCLPEQEGQGKCSQCSKARKTGWKSRIFTNLLNIIS